MLPLPAPRGPLGQVDATPEVRESSGTRDEIDRGRERSGRKVGVHTDRGTVLDEDHPPERSQVAELLPAEENRRDLPPELLRTVAVRGDLRIDAAAPPRSIDVLDLEVGIPDPSLGVDRETDLGGGVPPRSVGGPCP